MKDVAGPSYRADELAREWGIDFVAERIHKYIQSSRPYFTLRAPNAIHKALARNTLSRATNERDQQTELRAGKIDPRGATGNFALLSSRCRRVIDCSLATSSGKENGFVR